ncbi:MAG: protein-L-isoaspartate(D-aspartate) O-methyltransferase [Pseudomonadota bacterium]
MTSQRTRERLVQRLRERGITDASVLQCMGEVPRHLFVDEALASRAYEDSSLPIGHGQTISQPWVVARMTEAILAGEPRPAKVLEIGTGCGYQTAVLAGLVRMVYSVERLTPLYERARSQLRALRLGNIHLRHGDGWQGWSTYAPYDAILCAAAPASVPAMLQTQLADGGRLVIPVGSRRTQQLLCIERRGEHFERKVLDPVVFVPLVEGRA